MHYHSWAIYYFSVIWLCLQGS